MAGLALSPSGTLSGTPTTPGSTAFTVQVTDASGVTTTRGLTLVSAVSVTGVTLHPKTLSLTAGGATAQLQATVSPSDATNPAVIWSSSNTAVATVSSTGIVTPVAPGTATITVTTADGADTASSTVTVSAAVPVWTPPTLTPEPVTMGSVNTQVIGNLGYNPAIALDNGTFAGYVEERAAIEAGATFAGEGTESVYLSAILDGSGVGLTDPNVTPEQQGQFAALYQKLGIIPTWTNNTVSLSQGIAALLQAQAPTLAIANYLVQMSGFSWTAAQSQAATGFPVGKMPG